MKTTKLSKQKTADFCRGMALLLHTGLPLSDSLFLLAGEEQELTPLLEQMGRRMDEGLTLSETMAESGMFPTAAVGLVQTGERTGYVEEALSSLAAYYQSRERAERQLRTALISPALLMLLMLVVIGVLLVKVLPVFDSVYASLGGQLTGIAGGLLAVGQGLRAAMPVLWVLLALAAVGAAAFALSGALRQWLTRLWQQRWGDRGAAREFNNAQFARALTMGLKSGLPVEESVALAGRLLADIPGAAARCSHCLALLEQGEELTAALRSSELLPLSACRMLTLGLRSGSGDQVMEEIALRLMEDAEDGLARRMAKVEPAMVMTASVLVGVILLSVMLPLMNIMSTIG